MGQSNTFQDTIVALSTPNGIGAIAVIRLSGEHAFHIVDRCFRGKQRVSSTGSHRLLYGDFVNPKTEEILDDVLCSVFHKGKSYTGERTVEISCHASPYIVQNIIQCVILEGARLAEPGEYTQRAYLSGNLDLAQAEAVADIIASRNRSQLDVAIHQMRGGLSRKLKKVREQLIDFASLIELENDFGEEDVAFADRDHLKSLCQEIQKEIAKLTDSFQSGQAIKNGISVAIVGRPNVGKSTLLNALLQEERAITSDIPGTTRDSIEDNFIIDGHLFRLIDTAGLRETEDQIEKIGIERTYQNIEKASVVLFLEDATQEIDEIVSAYLNLSFRPNQQTIILLNKTDLIKTCDIFDIEEAVSTRTKRTKVVSISAKENNNIEALKNHLVSYAQNLHEGHSTIVNNLRHHTALVEAQESITSIITGLQNQIPSDFVAIDIRHALNHLGSITGEITPDDLLGNIFSRFCIGK